MSSECNEKVKSTNISRWYFPGLAGAGGALITHPLDSMKVILQVQEQRTSMTKMFKKIVKNNGVLGMYKGLKTSMLRQFLYTSARFEIYECGKPYFNTENFMGKIFLAGIAGLIAGIIASPTDLITVRMQYDIISPPEKRRNYKSFSAAIIEISKTDGINKLYTGTILSGARGCCITIGQLVFYGRIKQLLKNNLYFEDNIHSKVIASAISSLIATAIFQPIDVLKTRTMVSTKDQYKGISDVFTSIYGIGPSAFLRGFAPALIRNAPYTIILFVLLEQLDTNFGIDPSKSNESKN